MAWLTKAQCESKGGNVLVSKEKRTSQRFRLVSGSTVYRLLETTETTTTEWRGLSQAAAAELLALATDNRSYSDWTPATITYKNALVSGTNIAVSAVRANEANGWRVTVVETSYSTQTVTGA